MYLTKLISEVKYIDSNGLFTTLVQYFRTWLGVRYSEVPNWLHLVGYITMLISAVNSLITNSLACPEIR